METEQSFSVGDIVTFGDGLVGIVESYNDTTVTVRVQAVNGDDLEPTDDVRQLGLDEVTVREQMAEQEGEGEQEGEENVDEEIDEEVEIDDDEEDDDEDIKKGTQVSFNTAEGKTYGIVSKVSGKATIEVYYKSDGNGYEPTGVSVTHALSDIAPTPFVIKDVKRKILCKFAGDIALEQDNEDVATFKGVLSSYGNVDLGGDVVDKGAYKQTLIHKAGKVKLFFDHFYGVKDVAGVAYLEDKEDGLHMTGVMPIKATDIRDAVIKMRFMLEHGEPLGLSIGYNAVKSDYDMNGNRILKEIALEEASITPFPMDTRAKIYEAKARKAMYQAKRSAWQKIVKKSDAPKGNRYSEGDIRSLLGELKSMIKTTKQ